MTLPRQVLLGKTYLVTRRCAQREFLLRPSGETDAILRYVLARAASRYGILIHAYCFMSNHYHLVLTDPWSVLPEFMRYFNEFTARALNVHYGRREALWSSEAYNAVEILSLDAVVEKVVYVLANPVAAGLVPRGERWPGLWSHPRHVDGPAEPVTRPAGFFRPKGPTPAKASLELVRPPGFASAAEFVNAVMPALRKAEDEAADAHRGPDGQPHFLGVAAILRQKPTDRPSTPDPRGGLTPRVASRHRSMRIEALARLKTFLAAYRHAWRELRAGVTSVLFPAGTYLLRVRHGVACAPS